MADWIVIEKDPDTSDLVLDMLSLGTFGYPENPPNVYRVENPVTGEQHVIKSMEVYAPGDTLSPKDLDKLSRM
jgi:hypothetical protein